MPLPSRLAIVLLVLCWLHPEPSVAQESPATRQELLRRQREERRAGVTPYDPNPIEEQMVRFDKGENPTLADWNLKGLYPRIAWPARGSGAALGLRYWQRDVWGPLDVAGTAFYSWRQYQHYDVQFGVMPHVGRRIPGRSWKGDDVYELGARGTELSRIPFYVTMRYRYLPQNDFYGLGSSSSLDDRSNFLQEEGRVYLQTGYQFTDHILWLVSGGFQRNTIRSGKSSSYPSTEEVFDDDEAPGLSTPPDYVRAGTQLLLDRRDEPGNPHRGFMAGLAFERFEDRTEDAFSFSRIAIDVRAFLPLGSPQRVVALRAGFTHDSADAGHEVPFFMQHALGGSHNLRGFDSFRFRGEKVMLYQAEYRWEPLSFWELSVFADTGSVADKLSELSFSELHWDWGFGTRFKSYRDVVLRMEIAFSAETTRYLFRGSTSF